MIDLVTNYQPDVIWSDGDWEMSSEYWRAQEFLAWLYNDSPVKDTVVTNDRWGSGAACHHGGYYTCQDHFLPGQLQQRKWEDCDTLDKRSWGFRRNIVIDDVLTAHDAITRLATAISTGGNYLLNIGPDSNGKILTLFEERLNEIGQFVNTHADAIFATKPWIFQNDSGPTWYTSKLRSTTGFDPYRLYNPQQQNNTIIYAFVVTWPDDNLVNLTHIMPTAQTTVNLFSFNNQTISLPYTQPPALNGGIQVNISSVPNSKFPSSDVFVLKIEYAADQCPMNFIKSNTNSRACYSFINATLDWASANAACAKAAPGATLVSIGSAFENSEVDGLIKGSNNAYIGLQYQNNNWAWVNGDTSAYRNWANGIFNINFLELMHINSLPLFWMG
uniref:alpha-L-fucosidase n=1 Tax=Acrobeloides nanus TaxID=290746 RepID=A0A914C081_9BILA